MLLSLLLISVLSVPRAPADAEVVAYLPRLDQATQLLPFFTAAGSRAVLLRPESWRSTAHPLIDVDVTSREALGLVGIDASGSLTSSRLGDAAVACVTVSGSVQVTVPPEMLVNARKTPVARNTTP